MKLTQESGWAVLSMKNDWRQVFPLQGDRRFGTDYLARATVSLKNIYPNASDHAIYGQTFRDADGEGLTGERSYTNHLAPR